MLRSCVQPLLYIISVVDPIRSVHKPGRCRGSDSPLRAQQRGERSSEARGQQGATQEGTARFEHEFVRLPHAPVIALVEATEGAPCLPLKIGINGAECKALELLRLVGSTTGYYIVALVAGAPTLPRADHSRSYGVRRSAEIQITTWAWVVVRVAAISGGRLPGPECCG